MTAPGFSMKKGSSHMTPPLLITFESQASLHVDKCAIIDIGSNEW